MICSNCQTGIKSLTNISSTSVLVYESREFLTEIQGHSRHRDFAGNWNGLASTGTEFVISEHTAGHRVSDFFGQTEHCSIFLCEGTDSVAPET